MQRSLLSNNERSWAIEVITFINTNCIEKGKPIQKAKGENTVRSNGGVLFPDVLLHNGLSSLLQGWELKLPDTPISNPEFISNATKKAETLGLDSFLLWNGIEAHLYIKKINATIFERLEEPLYSDPTITCRTDISNHPNKWQAALKNIISKLNRYFDGGELVGISPQKLFENEGLINQLLNCHISVKQHLIQQAQQNNNIDAKIKAWWKYVEGSYPGENEPYGPLAFTILFRWFNRFVFANILKAYHGSVKELANPNSVSSIQNAIVVFEKISKKGDYYNVFGKDEFDEYLPQIAWDYFLSLNSFLQDFSFQAINKDTLQSILQSVVLSSIKKAAGLYVTPNNLAELLVRLSLNNRLAPSIDPFCGTGTILHNTLFIRAEHNVSGADAVRTTWGSDKFAFPVQIATLAVSAPETMQEPLRLFTCDAFSLKVGQPISFVDPSNGKQITIPLPEFSAIITNPPFVQFETIGELNNDAKVRINDFYEKFKIDESRRLSGKSDLYAYVPFILYDLLQEGGCLGMIASNSWLSADWGDEFKKLLNTFYNVRFVIISSNGRWFRNVKVVTTIIVCEKKKTNEVVTDKNTSNDSNSIYFVTTKEPLDEMDVESTATDVLIQKESDRVSIATVSSSKVDLLTQKGFGWISLFSDPEWLFLCLEKLVPVTHHFHISRGERRGWDKLFYPDMRKPEAQKIEKEFLCPVIKNLRSRYDFTVSSTNEQAFCCSLSKDELKKSGKNGALKWISIWENEVNGKGHPLPTVLKKAGLHWYQMDPNARAEFVLTMNPGDHLFVAKTKEPSFVNQRLVSFIVKDKQNTDLRFFHALLNSTLSMFMIESSGFGRGESVLDINATNISQRFFLPDLSLFKETDSIKQAFTAMEKRQSLTVQEELKQKDREELDVAIFESIGIPVQHVNKMKDSLLCLYRIRKAVDQDKK